jgi:uncharacterized protein (TIGR00369 family)
VSDEPRIWEEEPRGGYYDPALFGLSGLEVLRSMLRGHSPRPPLYHLTGVRAAEFGEGTAGFTMPATSWVVNSTGLISAGVLAVMADGALGCAIQTALPPATPYTTAELSITMLRPARPGGTLDAGGQLIHLGRGVALSEAFILDPADDALVAHTTSRCSIFPPLDPPPVVPDELPVVEPPDYPTPDPYLREPVAGEVLDQAVFEERSGLEVLRAQIAGELPPPPIHYLTGLNLTEAGEGEATFTLPMTVWLCPPLPRVQGGFIAMLADAALQGALFSAVPAGTALAGLDLKVNYLRPVEPDGSELVARGRIVHAGRKIAIGTAEVVNAEGKPVALATGSAMHLPGRRADLGGEAELAA